MSIIELINLAPKNTAFITAIVCVFCVTKMFKISAEYAYNKKATITASENLKFTTFLHKIATLFTILVFSLFSWAF